MDEILFSPNLVPGDSVNECSPPGATLTIPRMEWLTFTEDRVRKLLTRYNLHIKGKGPSHPIMPEVLNWDSDALAYYIQPAELRQTHGMSFSLSQSKYNADFVPQTISRSTLTTTCNTVSSRCRWINCALKLGKATVLDLSTCSTSTSA